MAKTLVLAGTDFSTNKLATVSFDGSSIPCTGISLDEITKAVTSLTAFTLTATPEPSNTTDAVTWATSDATVATVAAGVVTPIKLGQVTITATCGEYSAGCVVTIDNVVVPYKAVSGYAPFLRSSTGNSMTTGKVASTTTSGKSLIIAADQESGLYTIESKTDVDTSPYRFVPIMIPNGATKIIISTSLANLKTRALYIDSTKQQTTHQTGIGAYCVQGLTGEYYDQGSTAASPITLDIPSNVAGLDSCCICVMLNQNVDYWQEYTSSITLAFSYDT